MQLFQWVYGMQCMEMHCLLDEEGGEETEHGKRVDQNAISQNISKRWHETRMDWKISFTMDQKILNTKKTINA